MIIDCAECDGMMELMEEEKKQKWYEAQYECPVCHRRKTFRREFDRNGKVIKEEVTDDSYEV